jgi:hypothetical protein
MVVEDVVTTEVRFWEDVCMVFWSKILVNEAAIPDMLRHVIIVRTTTNNFFI